MKLIWCPVSSVGLRTTYCITVILSVKVRVVNGSHCLFIFIFPRSDLSVCVFFSFPSLWAVHGALKQADDMHCWLLNILSRHGNYTHTHPPQHTHTSRGREKDIFNILTHSVNLKHVAIYHLYWTLQDYLGCSNTKWSVFILKKKHTPNPLGEIDLSFPGKDNNNHQLIHVPVVRKAEVWSDSSGEGGCGPRGQGRKRFLTPSIWLRKDKG